MPQLLVNVTDQAMLPKLRRAIQTLQGVNSVVVPKEYIVLGKPRLTASQKKQLARVEELARLEDGWDGDGAIAIEDAAIVNVKSLIMTNGGKALEKWTIFPDTNGTLQLKAQHRKAVISLGNKDYSYIYHGATRDERASHEKMNISTLSLLIEHINE